MVHYDAGAEPGEIPSEFAGETRLDRLGVRPLLSRIRIHPLRMRHRQSLVALGLIAAAALSAQDADEVAYRFRYAAPGAASVTIEIAWRAPLASPTPLVVPRAIPMGYGEQRYDAFVSDVQRHRRMDGQHPPSARRDPLASAGRHDAGRVRVDLRRMEREVLGASDSSRIRDGYLGRVRLLGLCLRRRLRDAPDASRIEGPASWPIYSTLAPRVPATADAVDGRGADFYALADAQIVMGPRMIGSPPHRHAGATLSGGLHGRQRRPRSRRTSGHDRVSARRRLLRQRSVRALHDAPGAARRQFRRATSTG